MTRREVRLPAVGDCAGGELAEWYLADGDVVKEGEPLVAVDIDKVVIDVPSPSGGVLTINSPVGAQVGVGDLLGWVDDDRGQREGPH
jgi:2-oxoglutarate dehydrogenase E2 component (dihydrolipoamide succinyltransferase)